MSSASQRLPWTALACAALGATGIWWLLAGHAAPDESHSSARQTRLNEQTREEPAGDRRSERILQLSREPGGGAEQIIELYATWASESSAVHARRAALGALLNGPTLAVKLKNVLAAVARDETPAENDPLWPFITESLAGLWTPETIDRGCDLMLMEERPRAKRAVIASIVHYAGSERIATLEEAQRERLVSDLIDTYSVAEPVDQPAMLNVLGDLGGEDLVSILQGRTQDPNFKLQRELDKEAKLQQVALELANREEDQQPGANDLPAQGEEAPSSGY